MFPPSLGSFSPVIYNDVSLEGSDTDVVFRVELSTVTCSTSCESINCKKMYLCPRLRAATVYGYNKHNYLEGSLDKTRIIGLFPPGPETEVTGQSMIFLLWNGPQIRSQSSFVHNSHDPVVPMRMFCLTGCIVVNKIHIGVRLLITSLQ